LKRELPIGVALLVLVLLVSLRAPGFLSMSSMASVLLWLPLILVCALGQMLVIVTRGIDVSAGSAMALSGMLTAMLLRDHPNLSVGVGALAALGIGATLGAINGALILGARVPPIVTTLATLGVYRGLTFIVSQGVQINEYELPRALTSWTATGPFGQSVVPWVVVFALVMVGVTDVFLKRTRVGRDLFAIGGNPEAALLRGINVRAVTFLAYVLCGCGAGVAGVLYASRFGTVNAASIGQGFELLVIAAAVIGGTSVFGGIGSALGVFLGCLLLGVINVALSVLQIDNTWQQAVYGLVILTAVLFDDATAARLRRRTTGEA
jgi:rhamnose transport system permease protein